MAEKNHGKIIRKAIMQQGMKINEVAKKLKISNYKLYKAFDKINLEKSFIVRLGICIQYDFANEIPEVENAYSLKTDILEKEERRIKEKIYMLEKKYIKLLEHYTKLNFFLLNLTHNNHLVSLKEEITSCIQKIESIDI